MNNVKLNKSGLKNEFIYSLAYSERNRRIYDG
jgi:hypothetical protein